MTAVRRALAGLHARLLLSHLLVVLVGVVTVMVAARLTAPSFFDQHMALRAQRPGGVSGMMAGGRDMMGEELDAAFRDAVTRALLVAGVAAIPVAVLLGTVASRRIAGSVRRLAIATERIAAGHYAERVPAGGPDEHDRLAATFNEMAATLEDTEQRRMALIGDVAHELRTPLATLSGYLEGLMDEVIAPSPETWAMLHGEAERLGRLVRDLQELSRAEAHQLTLSPRAMALEPAVQAVVERLRPDFAAAGLELCVTVPAALPQVQADPDRLAQVLTNLLTNALRYTPAPGRVAVEAMQVAEGVRVSVRDTGVGIAPEVVPRVFERFYRVDKSRSRALGGSGVGLTIARALVEAMGGHIWAESPGPGKGATFAFVLPVATRLA